MGTLTFTHLDGRGHARMVDVGGKAVTRRSATASAVVRTSPAVIRAIRRQAVSKGDVLAVARIAGIQAAKRTDELIPLCHSLPLDAVEVGLVLGRAEVRIRATASLEGRTGVEMEALVAASAAALTVYDMCKALDRGMVIEAVQLEEKSGGRSGHWQRARSSGVSRSAKATSSVKRTGTAPRRSQRR
ncbi:MAG TPA: cyclic pyranopterin monophosphate synthase MoaC [Planctomycetes bacterium]|jgi:cyclic pyranopterin phosphate synthase|nr:cyclic pyranopterin monophosphate synthase MoaC [Planctomycetota bacterium]